jgi:hypothetical protein
MPRGKEGDRKIEPSHYVSVQRDLCLFVYPSYSLVVPHTIIHGPLPESFILEGY